jgi:hypothetical protein
VSDEERNIMPEPIRQYGPSEKGAPMVEIAAVEALCSAHELHLYPGESLIWVGRPSSRSFRRAMATEVFAGLVACLVASAAFVGSILVVSRDRTAIIWMIGSVYVLTSGVRLLSAPGRYRRGLARAVYAVTTERAVMLTGFGVQRGSFLKVLKDSDRSFGHAMVYGREVKRRRPDGSGDVVFGRDPPVWDHMGPTEIGFFGVTDVDELDALIGQAARSFGTRPRQLLRAWHLGSGNATHPAADG